MKSRKTTAWKKNRKFGDVYGGRSRTKLSDNIFFRLHSIERPSEKDQLPILMEDNPSRDFFFPLSLEEVEEALKELPNRDYEGITHIWLRRLKGSDFHAGNKPHAEFICGSGVRMIVLYPWPKDMVLSYGRKRPSNAVINEAEKFGAVFKKTNKGWHSHWGISSIRKYTINAVLYHEVGHHIDWYYRHWSKANRKQAEDYADQYAIQKTATATCVFNRLVKQLDVE